MTTGPKVVPGREGRRAPPKDGIERRGGPRFKPGTLPYELKEQFRALNLPIPQPGESTNSTIRYNLSQAAKQLGPSGVENRLIEMIEGDDPKIALQAIRLFYDILMVKESESRVMHGELLKPQIFLPESLPDPAKVTQLKKP